LEVLYRYHRYDDTEKIVLYYLTLPSWIIITEHPVLKKDGKENESWCCEIFPKELPSGVFGWQKSFEFPKVDYMLQGVRLDWNFFLVYLSLIEVCSHEFCKVFLAESYTRLSVQSQQRKICHNFGLLIILCKWNTHSQHFTVFLGLTFHPLELY